jgi:hypothetical protein
MASLCCRFSVSAAAKADADELVVNDAKTTPIRNERT